MNHPLVKFHRPRPRAGLRDAAGRQTITHRVPGGGPIGPAMFTAGLPAMRRPKKVKRLPVMPPERPEKPRRRWYQYSLRTLFLLTLIVSLLMSWYAVKMKKALAQKKAVDAIVASGGGVGYDYEFDGEGVAVKGAKGHGPAWLRDFLGPDYFDTVAHANVDSVEGMEGVNGLPRLRSLSIDEPGDAEDMLKGLQDIDGLEELEISGCVTGAALESVRRLSHVRRLRLCWHKAVFFFAWEPEERPGLAALQLCPTLRELILSDDGSGVLPPRIAEELENLSQLEKLTLSSHNISSSDLEFLAKLPALRELDLTGSSKIDEGAVPCLQKMTGLRKLTLAGTGISDEGAESIDDALPKCRVIY